MASIDTDRMLIESAMPRFDTVLVQHAVVAADPSITFQAAAPWTCSPCGTLVGGVDVDPRTPGAMVR
jgi:hypothetical protein